MLIYDCAIIYIVQVHIHLNAGYFNSVVYSTTLLFDNIKQFSNTLYY